MIPRERPWNSFINQLKFLHHLSFYNSPNFLSTFLVHHTSVNNLLSFSVCRLYNVHQSSKPYSSHTTNQHLYSIIFSLLPYYRLHTYTYQPFQSAQPLSLYIHSSINPPSPPNYRLPTYMYLHTYTHQPSQSLYLHLSINPPSLHN